MFIGLMLSAIMLGSIIGNILVITVIRREVTLHTPANFLICSLAVTDLLVAFLVMPFSAVYEVRLQCGNSKTLINLIKNSVKSFGS